MNITGIDGSDIELGDSGYDAFTDQLECPRAVKIASYVPAPSFFGAYAGFAPEEEIRR